MTLVGQVSFIANLAQLYFLARVLDSTPDRRLHVSYVVVDVAMACQLALTTGPIYLQDGKLRRWIQSGMPSNNV